MGLLYQIIGLVLIGIGSYLFWCGGQLKQVSSDKTNTQKIEKKIEVAKKEVLDEQQQTNNKIDRFKNEILEGIRSTYQRAQNEHEIQNVNIDEAAKRTFEVAKNKNANLILKEGYEKEGGFGTWFTPLWDISPKRKFYLADFVGNLTKNRISVFITEDSKLICQILTSDSRNERISVDINAWKKGEPHLIIVQWKTSEERIEFIIDKTINKKIIPGLHFDKLGPILFVGIDFEGKYPAELLEGGPKISEGLKSIGLEEYEPKFDK